MVISTEVQNAMLNAAAALVNGGDMLFREGTSTLLTFSLKNPAFDSADGGSAELDVTSPTMSATATGSASTALDNYQIRTSGGSVRFSGTIGEVDSGADIEMNHPDVELGDVCTVVDYTLTMPSSS